MLWYTKSTPFLISFGTFWPFDTKYDQVCETTKCIWGENSDHNYTGRFPKDEQGLEY